MQAPGSVAICRLGRTQTSCNIVTELFRPSGLREWVW
jgi:hypothetical protein